MADYSKKLSFGQNIANVARYATDGVNAAYGWQLPCTVEEVDAIKGFVTVNFEVVGTTLPLPKVTIPVMGWQWIRFPIQKGDAGVTVSIDTDTIFISEIASGKAGMTPSGNLGPTLMFLPIMQTSMEDSRDPDAVIIYGPNGVQLLDTDNTANVTVEPNKITMTVGDNTIVIDDSSIEATVGDSKVTIDNTSVEMSQSGSSVSVSSGTVNITGTLIINEIPYLAHIHGGVEPGPGVTTGVVIP